MHSLDNDLGLRLSSTTWLLTGFSAHCTLCRNHCQCWSSPTLLGTRVRAACVSVAVMSTPLPASRSVTPASPVPLWMSWQVTMKLTVYLVNHLSNSTVNFSGAMLVLITQHFMFQWTFMIEVMCYVCVCG